MNRRKIKPYPNILTDDGTYIPRQHLWHYQLKALAKWMLRVIALRHCSVLPCFPNAPADIDTG